MNNCYRVEVNQKSKYFKEKKKACDYFMKNVGIKDCELWFVTYRYFESLGIYIATQTLLDYYTFKAGPKC